jgi:cytochrome c553
MTGYEIGLLSTAIAFIAFALVVSLVVPRSRPAFPTPYLGAFIGVCIVFFFVQMTGVVLLAEVGEAHDDVAHEESEPGETTEPAPTEPAPTETKPTETTDTETEPTVTDPDEPTETTMTTETETGTTETEPTETETETGTTETSPPQAGGDPVEGRNLFVTQGCGTCHTLADAGAAGTICPNLDDTAPSFELVVDRVTNGQGAMPAFGDSLSAQQIRDIAAYVSSGPSRATS